LSVLDHGERGSAMREAVQIDLALWAMIIYLAMKAAHWIEYAF
jgi:hypothetical protein